MDAVFYIFPENGSNFFSFFNSPRFSVVVNTLLPLGLMELP